MSRGFGCLVLLLSAVAVLPAQAQNANAGQTVFRQVCSICHSPVAGRNMIGPSLFAIVGRRAGTVANYQSSPANKQSGLVWDQPTLDRYLLAPRDVVPGTKMTYAGLKDAQKRSDLIAYLQTLH